ncbi:MAG: TRAP transporter substrate-binding protein, partial [Candidatus Eremiobacteraeota bacterium]|nr:TRAP transporter substrate-binding protein [Candidatus Eremiobacteraeota bacterium]
PNGQLGSEREVLEQLQIGAVAFTKVSSLSLESFAPLYGALNAPFIFADEEHAYRVLDGRVGERLKVCSLDKKFRALTFYSSGARSFYADRPIMKPSDLQGLKIRVMGSQTALRMTELLGGSPAPMPYGEVYTGLQQKVIDGAENNITALTVSRHGEVAKHYSADEHIIAPDVLLVSTEVWERLSSEDRQILEEAAEESKVLQRRYWADAMKEHTRMATEDLGVTIHQPSKEPFLEAVQPLHDELKGKNPEMKATLEDIATQR